jgi:hypothetical protein
MPYLPEIPRHESSEVLLVPPIQDGANIYAPNYEFSETRPITRDNTPQDVSNLILSRRSIALLTQFYNRHSISRLVFLSLSHFIRMSCYFCLKPLTAIMCTQLNHLCMHRLVLTMFGVGENLSCLSPGVYRVLLVSGADFRPLEYRDTNYSRGHGILPARNLHVLGSTISA